MPYGNPGGRLGGLYSPLCRPDSPDALRQHQCLTTYPRGPQSPHWTFERNDERVSVKVQGPFATNNSESLRDAVLAGWELPYCRILAPGRRLAAGWYRSSCRRPVDVFAEVSRYSPYAPRVSRAVETLAAI